MIDTPKWPSMMSCLRCRPSGPTEENRTIGGCVVVVVGGGGVVVVVFVCRFVAVLVCKCNLAISNSFFNRVLSMYRYACVS